MINGLRTIGNSVLSSTIGSSKTDTSKDKNTAALVGTITLVVFSTGAYYGARAIFRSFTTLVKENSLPHSSVAPSTVEEKVNKTVIVALTPQDEANIRWGLPQGVKKTLDKLFEGSPYSIDALPFYPSPLDPKEFVEREKMTAPIMKGTIGGHRFIAIKLDGELTDDHINTHASLVADILLKKKDRSVKDTLVLGQYYKDGPGPWGLKDGALMWDGGRGHSSFEPQFFTWNFTYEDGSGPTNSQKDNFARVQNLIKTGASKDLRGMAWKIS